MKVLDIITEAPQGGDPLDMLTVTGIINAANGTEVQVRRIQELLSQHKKQGRSLWQGPIDGKHTPELDTAIMEWKRWVNEQLGEQLTDTSRPGLTQREVRYLRAPLTSAGRIDRVAMRGSVEGRGNPFEGQRFQNRIHEANPEFTNDRTENMRLFISSIGLSGWLAILNEGIETLADASEQTKLRQVRKKMAEINANLDSPPRWLNNLARVLEVAKYGNKEVNNQTLVAPNGLALGENAPQKLFEYYARLATFILNRDAQIDQAAADEVRTRERETGTRLTQTNVAAIVADLKRAFQFGFFTGNTDETTIEEIMLSLRIAGDYDAIAQAYKQDTNEDLNRRLAKELNDNDYDEIVRKNLLRIQKIMPLPLFRSIRFEDEDQIKITINEREFYVNKERDTDGTIDWGPVSQGSAWLDGDISSIQRDAIVEDQVLRAAIESTGGTTPENVQIERGDDNYKTARSVFENELQSNVPEMIAFYTGSEPFEFGAQVGNFRARGIMEQLALLNAQGGSVQDLSAVANEEILQDRKILIDELNVWFDPEYANEVSSDLQGFRNLDDVDDTDDADVEVLDVHQELAQKFTGTDDEEIDEATREILNSDNPADTWQKVGVASRDMGLTDRSERNSIDMMHDRNASSLTAIIDRQEIDNPIYRLMSGGIKIYLFPNQVAKVLEQAMGGNWDGTDEKPIEVILTLLEDRSQFEIVSRAFSRIAGNSQLATRLRQEDPDLYRQFYEKFNLDRPLRISTVETPFGEYQFELPNAVNRFKFTLTENTDPPMDIIPMRFGEIPEEGETERSAWLGYTAGRWNIYTSPDSGNPTPRVNGKLLESFLQFLERIGYDETGQPQN